MAQPTAEGFDIEVDDEGICRIPGHDVDDTMTFTVGDFARFLTEFVAAVTTTGEGDL